MIDKELLEILACPENHTRLQLADDSLVAKLNAAIAAGGILGAKYYGTPHNDNEPAPGK